MWMGTMLVAAKTNVYMAKVGGMLVNFRAIKRPNMPTQSCTVIHPHSVCAACRLPLAFAFLVRIPQPIPWEWIKHSVLYTAYILAG